MRQLTITPGYLQTARIPCCAAVTSPWLTPKDAPRVVVIDEDGARAWFPNQDPIGHQLRDAGQAGRTAEVGDDRGSRQTRGLRAFD